ncbi:uncharacterized protein METZ01_LOCUS206045 [marine metagenome]|uniref:Uncharacterized protein n=1 Tax=marine metagenome TaxID=408172 RepID=A0A382ETB7_9ZZZZ
MQPSLREDEKLTSQQPQNPFELGAQLADYLLTLTEINPCFASIKLQLRATDSKSFFVEKTPNLSNN